MAIIDRPTTEADERVLAPVVAEPRSIRRRLHVGAMRPRRLLVKVHRWLSFVLMAWALVMSITGAWLVFDNVFESWFNPNRYDTTPGDVGPQAAVDTAIAAAGPDAEIFSVVLPRNGRGVYQVDGEVPIAGAAPIAEGAEAPHRHFQFFIDPGTGEINDRADPKAGVTWWLYRGHMYLWQDYGVFNAFHPEHGWCRPNADGAEPGGLKGSACDVIPSDLDLVGWLGVGFIVVLLTGFYFWCWPGVRRWADRVRRQAASRRVHVQPRAAQGGRVRGVRAAARGVVHRHRLRVPEPRPLVRERHAGAA